MRMNDPRELLYTAVILVAVYYGTNTIFALAGYLFE
jgi:hypothetical protein